MRDSSLADWLTEGDEDLPPELPVRPRPAPGARGPRAGERPPRRRLWLVATAAWALVAALGATLVTGAAGGGEPAGGGQPVVGVDDEPVSGGGPLADGGELVGAGGREPVEPVAGGAVVSQQAGAVAAQGAGAPEPAAGAVATAAALTVRLTQTIYDEETGTSRYVDLALPAGVTWHGEVAIVTVDAVVLEGDSEGWGTPRSVRYVQPMRPGDHGPVPAGRAWTVPSGGGAPAPPGIEPVDEPELREAAVAALAAAGYGQADIREMGRARDRPTILVVTAEAQAPGESRRDVHSVWIDAEGDLRVLGAEMSDHALQEREPLP